MNKTLKEARELAFSIKDALGKEKSIDVVLCPPFTALESVGASLNSSNVSLGAQDMYWQSSGAYTGEVSPAMIKDVGCRYVIIGHSERRAYFSETNETVNSKLKAALLTGLTPIVCVGEMLKEREAGKTFEVIKDHIDGAFKGLKKDDALKVVIAYEPVWAIGTGVNATPEQAEEVHKFIRGLLREAFGEDAATSVRIQYGGSVKPDNIKELISQPDIDGALVGGASLEAGSFIKIVEGAKTAKG